MTVKAGITEKEVDQKELDSDVDPEAMKKVEAMAEDGDEEKKDPAESDEEASATDEEKKAASKESEVPAAKVFPAEDDVPVVQSEAPAEDSGLGMSKDDLIAKLLTDPDNVINEITQKVIAKVDKRTQDEIEYKQIWNKFYEDHSDLADFKDLVGLKAKELRSVWAREKKDVSWNEGQKTLAEAVRAIVKRARGSESEVEEVGNSKAVIASSSGNSAPRNSVKGDSASGKTFADQIQKFQAKFSNRR
jgi:hypothetical protein